MNAPFDMIATSPLWEPHDDWRPVLQRALDACAHDAGPAWPGREISVLLCDDAQMRTLNMQWRRHDKATNVLSFPASGPSNDDLPLGDVAIAFETAAREARLEGKSLSDHVAHLAVHGVLHLLGHDHETNRDAERMETAERVILAALGIGDPYAAGELAGAEGASP